MLLTSLMLAAMPAAQDSTILIDRNRIDRAPAPQAPPAPDPAPRRASVVTTGNGTPIKGVRFVGTQAPAPVALAARGFLGKPATIGTLRALADALSAAYAKSDIALYTVAVADQDFSTGVVTVRLTEGRIASAAVRSDDPEANPVLRKRMLPLLREKPLSRRTMERQFTLMRAIPGLTIAPDFRDPQGNGALALTVAPKQRRRKLSAGFSNRGIDLLGDGQFDLNGQLYGGLTDGDQLTLSAATASDFRRFGLVSVGYQAPLAASGLTIAGSAAYLATRPRRTDIEGEAKVAGVALSYPWRRSFTSAGDVSIAFDGLDSDNAVFGNLIASERTRAVRAAASFSRSSSKRSVSLSGSFSQGVDVLGARVTAPLAETSFVKATLAAGVAQAIGKRAALRVNVSGQFSRDRLPAAERYAVGGEVIGRAFDTALLTGDRGAGGLAEFAYRPIRSATFANSEVYAFADAATIRIEERGSLAGGDFSLASAGVGGRVRLRDKYEFGLEAAHVIDAPFEGYADDWRFSVAWRISM